MDNKSRKKIIIGSIIILFIAVVLAVGMELSGTDKIIDPAEILSSQDIEKNISLSVEESERSTQELIGLMSQSYNGATDNSSNIKITVTMIQDDYIFDDSGEFNAKTYYNMTAKGEPDESFSYGKQAVLIGDTVYILTNDCYIEVKCQGSLKNAEYAKILAKVAYHNYQKLN